MPNVNLTGLTPPNRANPQPPQLSRWPSPSAEPKQPSLAGVTPQTPLRPIRDIPQDNIQARGFTPQPVAGTQPTPGRMKLASAILGASGGAAQQRPQPFRPQFQRPAFPGPKGAF